MWMPDIKPKSVWNQQRAIASVRRKAFAWRSSAKRTTNREAEPFIDSLEAPHTLEVSNNNLVISQHQFKYMGWHDCSWKLLQYCAYQHEGGLTVQNPHCATVWGAYNKGEIQQQVFSVAAHLVGYLRPGTFSEHFFGESLEITEFFSRLRSCAE